MSRRLVVEHRDGTDNVLPHIQSEIEEEPGKLWQARIKTSRAAASKADLQETDDEIIFSDADGPLFGGVLRDIERDTETATLIVDTYERYALDAKPTPAGQRWENVDDTAIIKDAISNVPQLSEGTIENVKSGLSFIFSHATQAKKMRKVAGSTGAHLQFNDDRTVDYVDRIGTDRSETLSPASGEIVDKLRVERKGGEDYANHIRMLGAGEGPAQRKADVVASDYNGATDRAKWRVYANKDQTDTSTLREQGQELIAELEEQWVEITTTLRGVSPELGDTFHVSYPEHGLDGRFSVVKVIRKISNEGKVFEVTLSSRVNPDARETSREKSRKDIQRYNKAVQGVSVPIHIPGRDEVASSEDFETTFYYQSDVVYEHRMTVRVKGRAYRTPIRTVRNEHSGGTTSRAQGDKTDDKTSRSLTDDNWTTVYTHTVSNAQKVLVSGWLEKTNDSPRRPRLRLHNSSQDRNAPNSAGQLIHDLDNGDVRSFVLEETAPQDSDQIQLQIKRGGNDQEDYDVRSEWLGVGHGHVVNAGIRKWTGDDADPDFGDLYPKNCDVIVNGNSQGVSFGDGTGRFEDVVDIRGELNTGQDNEVRVTSGSRGRLEVYVEGDVYRQIIGGG